MNPIDTLARSFYDAIHNQLQDIEYTERDWVAVRKWRTKNYDHLSADEKLKVEEPAFTVKKTKRPSEYEATVFAMFPQSWSSTSLGFGGIGGQAFTPAYTVIIECIGEYVVYFGGRFAYKIERPNEKFFEDVSKQMMTSVADSGKYQK